MIQLNPLALFSIMLAMFFVIMWWIISLEGPLLRLRDWLDQFILDVRAMKDKGADPKNLWEFYRVYRKYKKGELK